MVIKTLGVMLVACLIYFVEYRNLKDHSSSRERGTFFSLLSIGVIMSILEVADVKIPNPLYPIEVIYKPVHTFIFNLLS
ncbi:hypothetical protein ACTWQL_06185 [Pseudalkalibacillus sp. R45]|uniref:hypothetical protein n=1 Tax=Pseudalkalibacillus sp. R45 TaxID=3457433 RepID=UPI003FCE912F